ncbi:MAG: NAD(P)H-hydrate dehydratase [Muribaculaceae bacterium]|nr:NAD(P)H-hydrate dehydratase [Muribaculaceae bacterium]
MKIFTSQAIHELDSATCEAQQISSIDLMERASELVADELNSRFLPGQRFVVMAGPGNNGGDALAVARMLIERGYKRVEVFLFNVTGKLSHDCDEERKKLITIDGVDFTEVSREFNPPYLSENDVVIDGLFGSGLNKPLMGGFVAVTRYINESGAYVVSIDLPSGLFGEWNSQVNRRDIIHANLTLAFQMPRLSFFFEENYAVLGEWKLLDIDLDETKIKELPAEYMLVESRNIRPLLQKRLPFTGKRDYGSALLFAGSTGMMGAAVMCSRSTLRSGAGLVTVHGPKGGISILQTAVPEAMFEPDRNEHFITDMRIHHDHQAIAVGPGIGTHDQTVDALEALLKSGVSSLVLDADALNCISKRPSLLSLLPPKTIITPHIGEFDRLFGEQRSSEDRLKTAIEMARQYGIIIVLKGHYTATVRPTGRVYINPTGNPGMATAGAGDVLTGIIAAFLAQGYKPEHAATIGVFVHGLAGDIAAEKIGEFGMTAGDIAAYAGRAIRMIIDKNV